MELEKNTHISTTSLYRNKEEHLCLCGITKINPQLLLIDIDDYLHEDEVAFFKLLSPLTRKNYVKGRYLVKRMLANYYQEDDLKKIIITNGVFGQPIVKYNHSFLNPLHISFSHTNGFAVALAFPDHHLLGIDIESICDENQEDISAQITNHEKGLYENPEDISVFYTRIWTIKEALSKAIKTGLTIPFPILEIQNITCFENYSISCFTNFYQYKALSFRLGGNMISIVLPKQTTICASSIIDFFCRV